MPLTSAEITALLLYRDADLLVLNKPAGLQVHYGTKATDHLDLYFPLLAEVGEEVPRLVHRLDKDTAGCLLLARSAASAARASHLFARGLIGKTYWAVVEGDPGADTGIIDLPLLKVTIPGLSKVVASPEGKPALTRWTRLGGDGRRSWLELHPLTGRMHQLRAHCAYAGFPMLGDPIYGPQQPPPVPLHLLARAITIPDGPPGTPAITATAPPPDHMAGTLAGLGWDGA